MSSKAGDPGQVVLRMTRSEFAAWREMVQIASKQPVERSVPRVVSPLAGISDEDLAVFTSMPCTWPHAPLSGRAAQPALPAFCN